MELDVPLLLVHFYRLCPKGDSPDFFVKVLSTNQELAALLKHQRHAMSQPMQATYLCVYARGKGAPTERYRSDMRSKCACCNAVVSKFD
ncbi:hypothetical protein TcWFU_006474 [Taenia crassiceps]|uniref:Uncharacterized protein n=1 Tax=Taenia crassiceps TaxID=6207 RepID=A0ABR4Q7F6_9CEST